MAEPKSFKVEDLKKFFEDKGLDGTKTVAALAEQIKEDRKAAEVGVMKVVIHPDDYVKAVRVLEGHIDRDGMNAIRRVALAYAVENQPAFASWLDVHAAALEIEEPEAVVEPALDELEPIEEPEEVFDDEE